MSKKSKCYEDGGEIEFETKTGENESIGDDLRARAMKAIAEGGQKDEPEAKKITRVARKVSPKTKSVEVEKVTTEKFNPAKMAGIDTSRFKKPPNGAMAAMGFKSGGKVSSASKRADGCAIRGKTKA